ncbi:MAG: alcohol dehydrogenase catalytic domain-containing protein, partial [Planctomycetes bacterium]|nr:alcohol dehydrogenase catalytic domain-containing protein [Planctomycetota bacterium]
MDCTGLNFLDVMNALDLISLEEIGFGGECAGRVVAVGEGVHDFSAGDRVVAL